MTAESPARRKSRLWSMPRRPATSRRLPLERKVGFVREMANGLNNLATLVERAIQDCAQVMEAVAAWRPDPRSPPDTSGLLGSLQAASTGRSNGSPRRSTIQTPPRRRRRQPAQRSTTAPTTSPSAPSSRPPPWRRPPPPPKNSRPRSRHRPVVARRRSSLAERGHAASPRTAAGSSARRSTPWPASSRPARRSPTSPR